MSDIMDLSSIQLHCKLQVTVCESEAAHHSGGQVRPQRSPAQDQRQHSEHHHPADT